MLAIEILMELDVYPSKYYAKPLYSFFKEIMASIETQLELGLYLGI